MLTYRQKGNYLKCVCVGGGHSVRPWKPLCYACANDGSIFNNPILTFSPFPSLFLPSLPPLFSHRMWSCQTLSLQSSKICWRGCCREMYPRGSAVRAAGTSHTQRAQHTHTEVHINLRPISAFMSTGAQMNSSVRRILLDVLIKAGNTGWCSLRPSEDG